MLWKAIKISTHLSIWTLHVINVVLAVVVTLGLPGLYYWVAMDQVRKIVRTETIYIGRIIEQEIQQRPDLWTFELLRLQTIIAQPSAHRELTERSIRDASGTVIVQTRYKAQWPVTAFSLPLYDSGRTIATLTIHHSLVPQVRFALILGCIGCLIGWCIYFSFRKMLCGIKKREDLLLAHRETLAETVRIRTQELTEHRETLEETIRKRTDELEFIIEMLREAKAEAEAANASKSQFLANMSHEIRTPMNGIIGMAAIGLESAIDEDPKNIFSTIVKEAEVLNELINDILDLSKIEAGKIELEEIPLDFQMLITDLVASFSYRCTEKNLSLDTSACMRDEAPHLVIGDPTRVRQIFNNLVGNAIKFTPAGGKIVIACTCVGDGADEAMYKFMVCDTGIGIPKDKHNRIFQSFTQADGSTTRQYGGTGLGTKISKQLVELMGGEIGFESEPGRGSAFWFVLPLKKQKESVKVARERTLDLKDYKICLISDTDRFPGTHDDLLSLGCTPLQATLHEATAMFSKCRSENRMPDLIIIDCRLPGTDSFACAGDMKSILADDAVPLMLLMSTGSRGDGKRCREEGIQAYLTRPVERAVLLSAIFQVISNRKAGNTAAPEELVTRYSLKEARRAKRRILLVEDYPTNQKIALTYLLSHAAGFEIDLAENGEQAVGAFERKAYDLIFMDVQMPVMDGYDAVRIIRTRECEMNAGDTVCPLGRKAQTPIIAMTAHAMTGDREKCLTAGMDDYLAKPIRKAELLRIVDKWLDVRQTLPTATALDEGFPADMKDTPDPLDIEATIDEFEGNRTMVSTIIQEFLHDVDAQIVKMKNSVSNGELEVVRKEAHSIKGGAANINARDLSRAASNLEQAARASEASACGDLLQCLSRESERVNAYMTELSARGLC